MDCVCVLTANTNTLGVQAALPWPPHLVANQESFLSQFESGYFTVECF